MLLRRFDRAGRREYLDEIRPRFVVLRLRTDGANITWGGPLWAAEEVLGFMLGTAALIKVLLPLAPRAWRQRLNQGLVVASRTVPLMTPAPEVQHVSRPSTAAALMEAWRTVDSLAGGALRGVLRIPPGEPYVEVRTGDTLIEIATY